MAGLDLDVGSSVQCSTGTPFNVAIHTEHEVPNFICFLLSEVIPIALFSCCQIRPMADGPSLAFSTKYLSIEGLPYIVE